MYNLALSQTLDTQITAFPESEAFVNFEYDRDDVLTHGVSFFGDITKIRELRSSELSRELLVANFTLETGLSGCQRLEYISSPKN